MNLFVKDAAEILSVSEKTIYRWIKQGSVPAYRVNEQYRFNRAELLEWATSRRINVAPELFMTAEPEGEPLPTLSEALEAGGIFYRIEGGTRDGALAEMVRHLRLPDEVNREALLRCLIAREYLASTATGDGVALPHVRHPEMFFVEQAMVSLCFLENPVDFHALDGKPVRILFHLLAPTLRGQEHLLSLLRFALKRADCTQVLLAEGRREEISSCLEKLEQSLGTPRQ